MTRLSPVLLEFDPSVLTNRCATVAYEYRVVIAKPSNRRAQTRRLSLYVAKLRRIYLSDEANLFVEQHGQEVFSAIQIDFYALAAGKRHLQQTGQQSTVRTIVQGKNMPLALGF